MCRLGRNRDEKLDHAVEDEDDERGDDQEQLESPTRVIPLAAFVLQVGPLDAATESLGGTQVLEGTRNVRAECSRELGEERVEHD